MRIKEIIGLFRKSPPERDKKKTTLKKYLAVYFKKS